MKKDDFMSQFKQVKQENGSVGKMVVAVKLPSGASELIINNEQIESKVEYYNNAYDDDMCLKTNPVIRIVACLFA